MLLGTVIDVLGIVLGMVILDNEKGLGVFVQALVFIVGSGDRI